MWYRNSQQLSLAISLTLTVAVLLASVWLAPTLLVNRVEIDAARPIHWLGNAAHCNPLKTRCRVGDQEQHIDLSIDSPPMPLTAFPFTVEGRLPEAIQSVSVNLDMLDMNMAANHIELDPQEGKWHAEAILPICSSARNDWRLVVNVVTTTQIYQGDFFFSMGG